MSREDSEAKKGGCLKKAGIGCLTVIVLLAIGGFFIFRTAKSTLMRMTAECTDATATELPVVQISESEQCALLERVDAFAKAVKAGESGRTLSLTGREINALIQKSPDLAGRLYVTIEGDRIRGDASIPLDRLISLDMVKGRWLNGSVGLSVSTVSGRFVVFMDSLSVRGKAVPDQVMAAIRSKNLAERALEHPKAAQILQHIEKVTVANGRMVIEAR